MNNTLASMVSYAKNTGRLVYEVWGDSTVQRSGGGQDAAFGQGLAGLVQCAGQMFPVNTTTGYNDSMGLINCRRRDNASTKGGVINDVGVDSGGGYPVTQKQYGFQIPVPASTGWSGAQAAYYAGTTLTLAMTDTVGLLATVSDTSAFPASGRIRVDSEIMQYSSKTATTFVIQAGGRGNLGSTAATHSNAAVVGFYENNNIASGLLYIDRHPLGSGAAFMCSLFYCPLFTGSAACFQNKLEIATQADQQVGTTPSGATITGALNPSGAAIGTINVLDSSTKASSDITQTSGIVSVTAGKPLTVGNGWGLTGPAAYLLLGVFEPNRAKGFIQSCGVSQGGKTINQLYKALRNYDVTNTVCEFDAGLLTRYKIYTDATNGISAAARGGNSNVAFAHVVSTGHNEASGSTTETALVDSSEAWTIARQTTINGGTAVTNNSTTAITLASVTGIPTTGGHVLIGTERIIYTGVSGSTITGITRGAYGTVPAAHADASVVYQGNTIQNPIGLATDLLFDFNLKKAQWIAAGGTAATFWYIWVRPVPTSASPSVVADDTGTSGNDQKEYKLQRFASVVAQYLGSRDCFVIADMSKVYTGGESTANDMGIVSSDQVHLSDAFYVQSWNRYFSYDQVAQVPVRPPRGRR